MKILSTLILSISLLLSACSQPVAFKSSDITGVDWGKTLSLTDHNGKPRQLADFKGQAIVLFFGYTQCPDVCPTTLLAMRDVLKRLGDSASRVQVLFVTLDPERDSAQTAVRLRHPPSIRASSACAVTTPPPLSPPRSSRSSTPSKPAARPPPTPWTTAPAATSLTRRGRLRLLVRHGEPADSVASDIKQLLDGQ
jgi:protein SCO1/2